MDSTQISKSICFGYMLAGLLTLASLRLLLPNLNVCTIRLNIIDALLVVLLIYITLNRFLIQPYHPFSLRYYEFLGLAFLFFWLRHLKSVYYPYLISAVLVSGIIQAVYGNLQLLGYASSFNRNFKLTGVFFNPGPFAGFLASILTLAVGLILFEKKARRKDNNNVSRNRFQKQMGVLASRIYSYSPYIAIITILLVLPAAQSRAAWVAAGVGSLFLFYFKYHENKELAWALKSAYKKIAVYGILIMLLSLIVFTLYKINQDSVNGRLLIWKISLNMIEKRPWIGLGFDQFKSEYMMKQAEYFQSQASTSHVELNVAGNVIYGFNELLQYTVENGLIGSMLVTIIFLLLFSTSGTDAEKKRNWIAKAGLLCIGTFSIFSYPTQILPIKTFCFLMMAILGSQYTGKYFEVRLDFRLPYRFIFAILLICISYILINQIEQIRTAFYNWKIGYENYEFGLYKEAILRYEQSEQVLNNNGEFLTNYGKAQAQVGMHHASIVTLKNASHFLSSTVIETSLGDSFAATNDFNKAKEFYWRAWHMAPNRFYPKYLLAMLHYKLNEKGPAQAIAKELLTKKVKVESIAIGEMKSDMEAILSDSR